MLDQTSDLWFTFGDGDEDSSEGIFPHSKLKMNDGQTLICNVLITLSTNPGHIFHFRVFEVSNKYFPFFILE